MVWGFRCGFEVLDVRCGSLLNQSTAVVSHWELMHTG